MKKIATLSVVAIVALAAVGCGCGSKDDAEAAKGPSAAEVGAKKHSAKTGAVPAPGGLKEDGT